MQAAQYWIEKLKLEPHIEGGYFKRTFCSEKEINNNTFSNKKTCATAIYYLLEKEQKSHFHKITSDEMWFFHCGSPLNIYTLSKEKGLEIRQLGCDFEKGQNLQVIVPANTWFAAQAQEKDSFTLVSCAVAPSFDFEDFQLAKYDDLIKIYAEEKKILKEFCKK